MRAIKIENLPEEAWQALDKLYRTTRIPRTRTRSQMISLSAEQGLKAPQIAEVVRESENTVQRWLIGRRPSDIRPKAYKVYMMPQKVAVLAR